MSWGMYWRSREVYGHGAETSLLKLVPSYHQKLATSSTTSVVCVKKEREVLTD
jgi:hypothetical protein